MHAVWVHSMRFEQRGDDVFSEAMLPYKIWHRYLKHFDRLTVVGRTNDASADASKKFVTKCSGPHVDFQLMRSVNNLRDIVSNSRAVKSRLREIVKRADAVIARLPSEHGLLAIDVASEAGKPFAVELVGCAFDALWNHGDWRGKLYAPVLARRVKRAVGKAPYVLYVTKEFLQRRYPAMSHVSQASNVELTRTTSAILDVEIANAAVQARRENSASTHTFSIGMIAAFNNAYKGHEVIFKALQVLKQQGVRVRLRLLGAGDAQVWQRKAAQLGLDDWVSFEGVLPPGDAVNQWLRQMDLYVQPSLTEGLPRALVEAMASGLPALAAKVGGIPELLPQTCLHRPGDYQALASQIKLATEQPAWRESMSQRNQLIAQDYTSDVLERRRDEFWSSFAAHCRQQPGARAAKCA